MGPRTRPGRAGPWLALAVATAAVGWLDYHAADDVQLVLLALLIAALGLGFWRPSWFWLTALVLWTAIPLAESARDATNHHPGELHAHPLYETLIALLPALVAAAAGAALRRWGAPAKSSPNPPL